MKTQFKVLILSAIILIIFDLGKSNAQWVQRYNGPGNGDDEGKSIVLDDSGNVYTASSSLGIGTGDDFAIIKYNSSGVQQWVQRYNGPGNSTDQASSITVDRFGNVYVTGYSIGNGTNFDYATVKYTSSGAQQWVQRYNGPANYVDIPRSVKLDSSGNVYVTGDCYNTNHSDCITLKYNSAGDLLWVRIFNRNDNYSEAPFSLAVDGSGNVYITGYSSGGNSGDDITTIKYNASGTQQWVRYYNGPANWTDIGYSIAVDESGNVYVAGNSMNNGTADDCVILKYNSYGVQQWVKRYNGPGNYSDAALFIAIDSFSNIYVTGYSWGIGTGAGIITIKYDLNGNSLWVRRYESGSGTALALDGSGNVYVSGSSTRISAKSDITILKYNSSGLLQWIQNYDGPANGDDIAFSMAVDCSGNSYVTGRSEGIGTGNDCATIKFLQPTATTLSIRLFIEGFYSLQTDKMVKDTVTIYSRNGNPPFSIIDSAEVELDSSGNGVFNFSNNIIGSYIVVKHRNSIETWSSQGLVSESGMLSYDFTNTANTAYGNNLVLKGSKYCIYSGDVNQDKVIDLTDVFLIYNNAQDAVNGYINTDLTGDNFTDLSDLAIAFNNSNSFVGILRP